MLTLRRGGVILKRADGASVNFSLLAGFDAKEITLIPAGFHELLTLTFDAVEARNGRPASSMRISLGLRGIN